MKAISIIENQITLYITNEEISILCKALKVACEEIEEWEFQIRLGIHLKDARILLESLTMAIEKMSDTVYEGDVLKTYTEPNNLEPQDSSLNQFAQIGDDEWLICSLCVDPWICMNTLDILVKCPRCHTHFRNPCYLGIG